MPLRDAGVVADEWPNADLRILPKAGHWPQFEAPQTTRRLIASYLGLPLSSDKLNAPVANRALVQIRDIAQFLAHSDIANNLNLAQRIRLAAQAEPRIYEAGETIAGMDDIGSELYVVYRGTVEVWSDPDGPGHGDPNEKQHVTDLRPGTMTGEYSMFDQAGRSADLVAGKSGATVLAFERDRLAGVVRGRCGFGHAPALEHRHGDDEARAVHHLAVAARQPSGRGACVADERGDGVGVRGALGRGSKKQEVRSRK